MALDEKPAAIERMVSPSSPSSLETTRNNSQLGHGDVEKALATHEDKDAAAAVAQPADPDIVDWDGPDDKENPLNWPAKWKWTNIALLSMITLLTSVAPANSTEVWTS
jgi:hypothetical protein